MCGSKLEARSACGRTGPSARLAFRTGQCCDDVEQFFFGETYERATKQCPKRERVALIGKNAGDRDEVLDFLTAVEAVSRSSPDKPLGRRRGPLDREIPERSRRSGQGPGHVGGDQQRERDRGDRGHRSAQARISRKSHRRGSDPHRIAHQGHDERPPRPARDERGLLERLEPRPHPRPRRPVPVRGQTTRHEGPHREPARAPVRGRCPARGANRDLALRPTSTAFSPDRGRP